MRTIYGILLCLLLSSSLSISAAVITTGKDPQARLPFWQVEDNGMRLRLVQRLPDLFRGFFLNRGFDQKTTEILALNCGFQTVFKNISHKGKPGTLSYDLNKWTVYYKGRKRKMKTREYWKREFQNRKVSKRSMLALRWGLYPTVQHYRPGDYNWGMSFFGLKPKSKFDLEVVWQQHGKEHRVLIKNMQCGPDIHPDPQKFYAD